MNFSITKVCSDELFYKIIHQQYPFQWENLTTMDFYLREFVEYDFFLWENASTMDYSIRKNIKDEWFLKKTYQWRLFL